MKSNITKMHGQQHIKIIPTSAKRTKNQSELQKECRQMLIQKNRESYLGFHQRLSKLHPFNCVFHLLFIMQIQQNAFNHTK